MAHAVFSEQELKYLIKGYINKLKDQNISIDQTYLYGSYAKNTPREWSDVDLCIISSAFQDTIDATMMLMKMRNDEELLLSPVAFSPDNFVDENPLAWEIKQTGVPVVF